MEDNKKKVYITSLHLLHGGVEMAITLLANALVRRNYDVEILCLYNLGTPAYELDESVKISYLTDVKPNRTEFYRAVQEKKFFSVLKEGIHACKVLYLKKYAMKREIQKIESGTILSTRTEHTVLLAKYGQKGVKKVAQLHHDHRFDKKLLRDFAKRYNNIDVFVLLTKLLEEEIRGVMKHNHHTRLTVIPNFLPEIKISKNSEKKNQVVAVGRLHEVKGFIRMLDIWQEVSKKCDTVLKIIGDGEERANIERKIQELKLENKVILCGAIEHEAVLKEMEQSLACVMTSLSEAFPFVLIEAMASGLPIVAYDVRVGPRAIIQDGVNGYLIEDGDKSAFIEKLERIIDDDDENRRMSEQSKRLAIEFSEGKVIQKWIDIL